MKARRVLAVFAVLTACGGGGESPAPTNPGTTGTPGTPVVATVSITPGTATIRVDDTLRLTATPKTASGSALDGKTIAWSSSAPTVTTVSSTGLLTAVGQGNAMVSATVDGVSATATITVNPAVVVASIALDFTSPTIARGQTLDLSPFLRDAMGSTIPRRVITWTSSDPSVAQVDPSGPTGKLTAGASGSATITATVDGVSARSVVSVIGFSAIAAGPQFSCALTVEGKAYCAGGPYGLLATPLASDLRFTSVSSDGLGPDAHACAISVDGVAYCWGTNSYGELGTGDSSVHANPARVAGGLKFITISAGRYHSCAVTTQGDPYCWGSGSEGRLGTGDTTWHSTPVRVSGALHMNQIQAGANATCGIATGGQAYCWGRNDLGQVGSADVPGGNLGDFTPLPAAVSGPGAAATQVVTKGPRSCLLDRDRHAFCFGNNTVFELGSTTTERCYGNKPCSRTPVAVQTSESFILISTSMFATCGLTAAKVMLCWGMDYQSLFGAPAGSVPACGAAPMYGCTSTPVAGPTGFVTLTSAEATQCGIRDNGIAYCWGANDFGQRGTPGTTPDPTPRVFSLSPSGKP